MTRWTLIAIVLTLLIGGILYAVDRHLSEPESYLVEFKRIEIPALPAYAPATLLTDVQTQNQFPDTVDTREPMLLKRLKEGFEKHIYVERVERVALLSSKRIEVRMNYRVPVALVMIRNAQIPIDRNGVILPAVPGLEAELLPIYGVNNLPSGLVWTFWASPDIVAAGQLAALIESERERMRIVAIEVGGDRLQHDLRLVLEHGTRIIWQDVGGPPKEGTPTNGQKLRHLRNYWANHADVDRAYGPFVIDVRKAPEIVRQFPNRGK
jgi:hypothetical protein